MEQSNRVDRVLAEPGREHDVDRPNLIGTSPAFLAALELIRKVAACTAPVLIEGETGTGKELAARAIHYMSARRNAPFVAVNCGAIPESLLESELYGHERGAYTDARDAAPGLIAQAHGGSLLLDEIETMSQRTQVVLLRFLQDQEYRAVGGRRTLHADTRIIASSNADLEAMTTQGQFRQDLFFRLNVLAFRLPSLRERPGDAALLADAFLRRLGQRYQRPDKLLHVETEAFLRDYAWPGNVRELENLIHREYLFSEDDVLHFTSPRREGIAARAPSAHAKTFKCAKAEVVARFERSYVTEVLSMAGGNVSLAARLAHKERSAFCRLIRKHWPDGKLGSTNVP
ncbi:sigma-54 interacting transcriptional regulator [Luteibacter rhizovicinus]|uniref:Sigma-54 interacting transcriptional regulator n=1 Tax=Luteibacter rhizovicinus TaxID=242606 RepID=A0A4V2W463_9GAMM|nr:sigma-54 dependent transcriptional regulator [Luteibacter rhizovicinus]TCV94669.1 sigma-54 interacting transcriptional regulator [Luteibacter rhizovicinus]